MILSASKHGVGVFKKILLAPARALRSYINYKDKATTVKADALETVAPFLPPAYQKVAPIIKTVDTLRKKVTAPVVGWLNKLDLG